MIAGGPARLCAGNRSEKMDIGVRIENVAGPIAAQAGVWEMNHSELRAVRPAVKAGPALSATDSGMLFPSVR